MEPNTRQLTLDEMYFKKKVNVHLTAPVNQSFVNSSILDSGGKLPYTPILQETPQLDLSEPVFQTPSFSGKAGKFVAKNWLWLLITAGILVVVGVGIYKYQKKKKENQVPRFPHR